MPSRVFVMCLVVAAAATPLRAHHSFAAEFDYDLSGTIEGEVIEVLYVNPHARYFVSVIGEDGKEAIWDIQTRSTSALTRVGWTRDLIKVGDRVAFEGNLGRDNARKLWIREVTLPSGRVVRPVDGPSDDLGTEEDGPER